MAIMLNLSENESCRTAQQHVILSLKCAAVSWLFRLRAWENEWRNHEMELVSHSAFRERAYAMKKHHATRLHYDLRLEWNGVLLSWALPKGLSCLAGAVHTAIEMEDHRLANLLFEGVHETGPIMLWDRGTWEPHPESKDIESCLCRGTLRFNLHGAKLKGGWMLTRTNVARKAQRPIWTLSKLADSFAASKTSKSVLEELPNSISTGRNLEEIVRDWTSPRNKHERQTKLFDTI